MSAAMSARSDKAGTAPPIAEGPAYPLPARVAAAALMAALAGSVVQAWPLLQAADWTRAQLLFAGVALLALGLGFASVMCSRTRIDEEAIARTGPWPRRLRWDQVQRIKLVRVPGLELIVVPRLVLRSGALQGAAFTAGDAALREAFRRIALHGSWRGEAPARGGDGVG